MIETYSQNITVATNTAIPLNNVKLNIGNSVYISGISTLKFTKCGVYKVDVSAVVSACDEGNVSIQLQKDGVLQSESISSATSADTSNLIPLGFTSLIRILGNGCNKCCQIDSAISIINTGVEAAYSNINVVVTRVS